MKKFYDSKRNPERRFLKFMISIFMSNDYRSVIRLQRQELNLNEKKQAFASDETDFHANVRILSDHVQEIERLVSILREENMSDTEIIRTLNLSVKEACFYLNKAERILDRNRRRVHDRDISPTFPHNNRAPRLKQ